MKRRHRFYIVLVWGVLCLSITGCGKKTDKLQGQAVPEVTTVVVQAKDTPVTTQFLGQTESSRQVEIRTRVNGFLEKRVYQEGAMVKAGQVMFEIEKPPFQASLQQAMGDLAVQQARLSTAKANLARIKPLAEKNAISKKDLDDAIGKEQEAEAAVLESEGRVRQAELNLGYTTIKSPVTGLSSQSKKQEGSYLSQGPDSLLTYVAQLDPIWVNFSLSENEVLKNRADQAKGRLVLKNAKDMEVEIILSDGTRFPHKGKIDFAEPSYSTDTGTFLIRTVLPNPKGVLKPGQFVRVKPLGAIRPNAIVLPQRAVQQGASGHFVWVVTKESKAESRPVVVGDWVDQDWFISEGLRSGDQVVVDGGLTLRPGQVVKVKGAASPPEQSAPATPPRSEQTTTTPGSRR
jgi:membrane fusion protein (multidrug efflux system)